MYECPNCTGNLKFDILGQNLKCDYCGTTMDPYEFQKERDAQETALGEDEYEVTVFTCPQCGGELIGSDTTAATFCSFCGGSTILDGRISRERRPEYIIPFQKTREDCRKAYGQLMRRAIFAPSELKDEEYISRFRSIYMPYWVYHFEKEGHVAFTGSQTERNGDYKITKYFRIESEVHAGYKGVTFDASASFFDNLSNSIAPFEWREARPFTPAFLSGFYADTKDVEAQLYQEDACDMVNEDMCREMRKDPLCRQYQLGEDLPAAMRPDAARRDMAMFPVWFLSYRKKDRVNYVVVNGQTGKAAGDIPVDKGKYLRGSFLLAIPIFIILNMIFSMRASTLLTLTAVATLICCAFSVGQTKLLRARRIGTDDKGRWGSVKVEEPAGLHIHIRLPGSLGESLAAVGGVAMTVLLMLAGVPEILCSILLAALIMAGPFVKRALQSKSSRGRRRRYGISWQEFGRAVMKPGIGTVIALTVLILKPVSDLYYYGAAVIAMALMGRNILELIDGYNLLATVELPQFGRRGGEEDGR